MGATDLRRIASPFSQGVSSGGNDADLTYARAVATTQNKRGWIQSPLFDLSLFTLSPLAGLLVILPVLFLPKGLRVFISASYLIAIPHHVSSFSFYLGDENLSDFPTPGLAFVFVP